MKFLKLHVLYVLLFCSSMLFSQPLKHQMRGAWIATVVNIDWPSKNDLSVEKQQKELIDMLNAFQSMNINTVIFQARPTSDAFFVSSKEPWSQYLTGKQGKTPEPFYDPLQFLIDEAHARAMEVHVWLNPYRVSMTTKQFFHEQHPFSHKNHLIKEYADKYYFDPGFEETRQYINAVVKDIVMRYDIDAVHFDDYFYPYKVGKQEFPDNDSFKKEPRNFEKNEKNDWRRNNVNLLISELQQTIKSVKPWVEFGISPFGVWRNIDQDPRGSRTKAFSGYDGLHADVLKWLEEGTIDYVAPQLYWEIGHSLADYKVLIDWWANNSNNKNLYIGLFASGLNTGNKTAWKRGNELARQLQLNKQYPQQDGVILYSARPLLKNPLGICDTLRNNYFKYPSLVPINRNIKGEASAQPQNLKIAKDNETILLTWDKVSDTGGKKIAYYVVYRFDGTSIGNIDDPRFIVTKTTDNFLDLSKYSNQFKGEHTFVVTSVNKFKHESPATKFVVKQF